MDHFYCVTAVRYLDENVVGLMLGIYDTRRANPWRQCPAEATAGEVIELIQKGHEVLPLHRENNIWIQAPRLQVFEEASGALALRAEGNLLGGRLLTELPRF